MNTKSVLEHNVYRIKWNSKIYEVYEIDRLLRYAVKSDSEPDIYRTLTMTQQDGQYYLECDCPSGFYRGGKTLCKHKKIVLELILPLMREVVEIENNLPIQFI